MIMIWHFYYRLYKPRNTGTVYYIVKRHCEDIEPDGKHNTISLIDNTSSVVTVMAAQVNISLLFA